MLITKATFLNYLECPTLSWFQLREKQEELTAGEELRILEGKELGTLARQVFGNGVLVESYNNEEAARITAQYMSDKKVNAIFEATFIHEGFIAKADVLLKDGDKWNLIEVKSSLHKEQIDEDHLNDIGYTTFVLSGAKVVLNKIEIMRISKDWRLGKSVSSLFELKDCKNDASSRASVFVGLSTQIREKILAKDLPKAKLQKTCKKCDYFSTKCIGQGINHSILEIPRITDEKAQDLYSQGIIEIKDIPDGYKLTDNQKRVVDCIKEDAPIFDRNALSEILSEITWPCYYLDFETAKTAVPFWEDVAPHEQILTQYSLHICDAHGAEPQHEEYLAPHTNDSRRELAEHMLERLGESGSIVVYSSFEKTQISALAKRFPDLSIQLMKCVERIFDLEHVFKSAYIHPKFCGQTSIKKTLPALVPELSYKTLEIGGGDAAMAAFIKMAKGLCLPKEIENLRKALLTYCQLDTLAMVKLHNVVASL